MDNCECESCRVGAPWNCRIDPARIAYRAKRDALIAADKLVDTQGYDEWFLFGWSAALRSHTTIALLEAAKRVTDAIETDDDGDRFITDEAPTLSDLLALEAAAADVRRERNK